MEYNIEYETIEKYLKKNGIFFGPIFNRIEELGISSLFVKPLLEKFGIIDAQILANALLNPKNEAPIKLFLKETYPRYLIYLSNKSTEIFCSEIGISDQKLFEGDILTLRVATNYLTKQYVSNLIHMEMSR